MPDEVTLRDARMDDAAAIAEIYNDAIQTSTATFDTELKSAAERRTWLAAHDERHPVLVAEVNDRVVGWASLSRWSDRPAYADTVESSSYVASGFRGQGIGRSLKVELIARAKALGLHTILARIAEGSTASLHLNQALGFELVGTLREVGMKFGRRLDVQLWQLMLK